jgi:hypothetical protein
MRKEFKAKLNGDESRKDASASFTLPFDTRDVWGRAKVPVKVTINGYTRRGTVGNRGGIQYLVVNSDGRRGAGVKAGDFATIALEQDSEKQEIKIPLPLQKALARNALRSSTAYPSHTRKNSSYGTPKPRRKTPAFATWRR